MSYIETHPWLTFKLDTSSISPDFWMRLGAVRTNCIRLGEVPLQPEVAKKLLNISLSQGAHATTAIEGNTLSAEEVMQRVDGELDLPPSREELGQEIDNVIEAYNKVLRELEDGGDYKISSDDIKEYNKILLKNLPADDWVTPGEFRNISVSVHTYTAPDFKECQNLIDKTCQWLNEENLVPTLDVISNGILRAIIAHLYIAWVHPFGDGNGRVARLVETKLLLSSGVPHVGSHLLTNHYNKTRVEYYRQLDHASRSGGDILPFIKYSLDGFYDALNEEFAVIRKQHMTIAWRNYIYDRFKDKKGLVNERKRKLVLDLSEKQEPTPLNKFREISPRIAEFYAGRTSMTIRRDIIDLVKMDLLEYKDGGYHARKELMESFLPCNIRKEELTITN